ncbi:MAG: DNA translocase FtsK [Blastocatellia bacterium]|nr:DNA translocase FtsK [Blastocatellia bacterium]
MTSRTRTKKSGNRSLTGEVVAVVVAAAAVLLMLSLVTYDPKDPSWNSEGPTRTPANLIGNLGAYLGDFFLQFFGLAALIIPVLMVLIAARAFFSDRASVPARKTIGAALLLIAVSGFLGLFSEIEIDLLKNSYNGGLVGHIVANALSGVMNVIGAAIVLLVVSVLTLMLTMEVSLVGVSDRLRLVRKSRAERRKGKPTLFDRLSAWWSARSQERHLIAEERRLEKDQEHRSRNEERERRLSEERVRRQLEYERLTEERRQQSEDKRRSKAAEVISEESLSLPPIISSGPATASDASEEYTEYVTEPDDLADASFPAEEEIPEPARSLSSTRAEMAKVVKARTARAAQSQTVRPADTNVTMDPVVAEMTSTISIERTPASDKSGDPTEGARRAGRRKIDPRSLFEARYELPSLDLLEAPICHREQAEEELRERAKTLAEKCKEFSVTGHIHRINPGPVVTTFEFKPDPGIKYSRVVGLADDLCLALKAESIRIDRIPGKSTVGIEVPNLHREKIFLRDVIESSRFQHSESKLAIALGKTINGEEYVADLMKMPHLLIAGATGAGKSVTLNAIICSILYKASPEEVKFIMVDPKRLELGLYEDVPHLLTPVVTDPKRASNALKWAVNEMENRYRELATLGVRNIDQYNRQVKEMTHPTLSEDDPAARKPLPYIVIAIDELADLMMVARGDVETSIARLAQMARAVGIHLVLATQRPSVDVITGVIKANFPSRIAFRVSSKVDSRTIIDSNGAEALLGQGDMLFLPPATSRLIRVHGSFVNEVEIKAITDHTRRQADPDYDEKVTMNEQESENGDGFVGERDELYDEALVIVTDMGRASTSVLQRRLSIGYGRAAKILDTMEHEGFIGPAEGARPRKVLQAAYEFRDRVEQRLEETFD